MIPGPDQVVACPYCGGLSKYGTLVSGNTFGARAWTDGKQEALMLPRPPAVVKCRHCPRCFWLSDAEQVGTIELWSEEAERAPGEWRSAEYVQEPEEQDYYEAIRTGLARDREQERDLRVFAWWRSNDAFRDAAAGSVFPSQSAPRVENLQALLPLLSEAEENDLLMKAEVCRELGEWAKALDFLGRGWSADSARVVSQIRALCQSRDMYVRELG